MRKALSLTGLLMGILMLVYSLAIPLQEAIYAPWVMGWMPENLLLAKFLIAWREDYGWLTAAAGALTLVAVVLLWLLRRKEWSKEPFSTAAVTAGGMLEAMAFLLSWTAALDLCDDARFGLYSMNVISCVVNTVPADENAALISVPIVEAATDPWHYLAEAYTDQLWLVILGAGFMLAGVISWSVARRKAKQTPTEEKPVKLLEREEWRITLFCTVMDIRGDYALVKYDDTGVESEVAIALLPFGIDTGDRLKYENYEFERV